MKKDKYEQCIYLDKGYFPVCLKCNAPCVLTSKCKWFKTDTDILDGKLQVYLDISKMQGEIDAYENIIRDLSVRVHSLRKEQGKMLPLSRTAKEQGDSNEDS